ncbi:hypothetical protein GLOTRDRAFT_42777 [Gloeophyllum trabeum ATCC 11539]|uniref:GSKIP domain-containing protein n=1 Tax=Gloeophyllum trabeum (strain ATCC 11539 / FP-39264 / Madison 617) TaxID=670483 RepID=S7RJR0_GLOTA|nr:uncharacterized protein GLOTRDRAFT_42777 [Gloeophyllum trabeum ATCC 11539]EPQ54590.1 hypothetical protein GLOTRDRAFT_42777 [Gloeophyllum trabeum ATCC 11539]
MSQPASFYRDELRRILNEQFFGVSSFIITGASAEDATASVKLLEGRDVTIILTARGYQVRPYCTSGSMYETIESLLRSISPMYASKYQEVLLSKLGQLSQH